MPRWPKRTVTDRFWAKVEKRPNGCWIWTASDDGKGYGRFWICGKQFVRAHRFAYEMLVGQIPDGMQIDHLCREHRCVNPDHLELVTNRENQLRGIGFVAENARKTQCKNGHEFNDANTIFRRVRGNNVRRDCRACQRLSQRTYYQRKHAPSAAA